MDGFIVDEDEADILFTELCKLQTISVGGMNCLEAQLRYKAILGTLHTAKIKPRVPNYWSDGFCFFPIHDLLEFFHKNGWKHINWVGDVDCTDCFDSESCKYYGTGNQKGTTTKDKYYKQNHNKLVDKLMILKIQ